MGKEAKHSSDYFHGLVILFRFVNILMFVLRRKVPVIWGICLKFVPEMVHD